MDKSCWGLTVLSSLILLYVQWCNHIRTKPIIFLCNRQNGGGYQWRGNRLKNPNNCPCNQCINAKIKYVQNPYLCQEPGYPTYNSVPPGLTFSCISRNPGYYADPEAQCQVWHWCLPSGAMFSFLCPNGTVFNQDVRVCDWWFNVDCATSPNRYSVNDDLYRDAKGNLI